MPVPITATYRLQLTRDFPIAAARELVGYLHKLGVSHLYLSPVGTARAGSTHGYDVVDHGRVNPELGTEDELRVLAAELRDRGMGIVLDIVPNHMAAHADNAWWDDVLQRGPGSRYAGFFDVDWEAPGAGGKVVLPVLGDEPARAIEQGELQLRVRDSGARIAYFDRTFPLDGATLPREVQLAQLDPAGRPAVDDWLSGAAGRDRLLALLDAQHYRLVHWRRASEEINYRRFFDVNDLVALRMDTDAVFDAVHARVLEWVRDDVIHGVRVDHVDGLRSPAWYLARLRRALDEARPAGAGSGARVPIFVEKILSGDESLPSDWDVAGTTGYDFMTQVEDLFVDADGFAAIEANYRGLRRNPSLAFEAAARDGKRRVLAGPLRADVLRVACLAHRWRPAADVDAYAAAIIECIVHLDVYRTYLVEPGVGSDADRRVLTAAFTRAGAAPGVNPVALDALRAAFFAEPEAGDTARTELVMLFQQTSGPAAAKGVEDTALYVHVPLASRNEVGGSPDRPLRDAAARMHARNGARAGDWPGTMLATNTHDTKRSADVRARLDALSLAPTEWARHVARWRRLNRARKGVARGRPAPDTNAEYLYYQTLLGIWPAPRQDRRADDLPDRAWRDRAADRLSAYMLKAAREAKVRTSWTDPDEAYEQALDAFVRGSLEPSADAPFLADVARLTSRVARDAACLALARVLLHLVSPGTPDIYQGDELWNFTLVDPDNRRPVDYQRRARLLEEVRTPDFLRAALSDGGEMLTSDRVKLALVERLLRFRRDHAALVRSGDYLPVLLAPTPVRGLFAFARRHSGQACIALARTRSSAPGTNGEATARAVLPDELAGRWHSVLTGRVVELERLGAQLAVPVGELIAQTQCCELLLQSGG